MRTIANIKAAGFWFVAFLISAAVTYWLPGEFGKSAFVDVMAGLISIACFLIGCAYCGVALFADVDSAVSDESK